MTSALLLMVMLTSVQLERPQVVGQTVCQSCHSDTHAYWQKSRHSKMVQPATTASVRGNFGVSNIELRNKIYGLEEREGKFYIKESFLTPNAQEHEIQYTLGNRRIQHYLTTLSDGRIIVLPPSWDILRKEWFHNLEIAAPDQKEEDGVVPVQVWNKNCFGCHVSEEVKNYDPVKRRYDTTWLDFGGNCERCHGPGSEHVEQYSRSVQTPGRKTDTKIIVPTKLDNERSSQICAQCHSFRDVMHFGYQAGDNYYDYFFPLLEYTQTPSKDPTWWADGKTRRFSTNALGLWQSECFIKGDVTCTNCHDDTHRPEIEDNKRLHPTNQQLCTGCHIEIGNNVEGHTFHKANSTGSACVDCHMPRSVTSIKAKMRDHSISIPSPQNTVKFNIPNACNLCHQDQEPEWAITELDRWYPNSSVRKKIVRRAEAFASAREQVPGATEQLLSLIADKTQGPFPRANAIGYLGSIDDPRVFPTLLGGLKDEHPMIQAISALKMGDQTGTNRDLAQRALLPSLNSDNRIVRMNTVISLLNLGIPKLQGESGVQFREALKDHVVRGAFHEDDAPQQLNLGRFHVLNGATQDAATAFENSFSLNPMQPGIKFLMAVTRVSQNRHEEAITLLQAIEENDPFASSAQNLLQQLTR